MFCWNWNNFILSIGKIVFLLLTHCQENFRPWRKNASTIYIRLVKNINGHEISAHRVPDSWTEHSTDKDLGFKTIFAEYENFLDRNSLRSRRLEVVGTRKKGRARRRHARGEVAPSPSRVSLARARSLFRPLLPSACYVGYDSNFMILILGYLHEWRLF